MVTTQNPARDHDGVAGEQEAGLCHASEERTKWAGAWVSDFEWLQHSKWRIPSEAVADANQGEVWKIVPIR